MKPLGDRVLVKRVAGAEKSRNGIILPDVAKEKGREGIVVAVGPGKVLASGDRCPLTIKPKDRVMFGSNIEPDFVIAGDEFLVLAEDEILGVMA